MEWSQFIETVGIFCETGGAILLPAANSGSSSASVPTFTYAPSSQIQSLTRTNTAYAWTGYGSGTTAGVPNGLNQLTSIGGHSHQP